MADFDVAIRGGYRDVAGLVLDCSPFDYVEEDGRVARWRNRAPRGPDGQERGRLLDPQLFPPADVTRRPLARPDGAVRFDRSEQNVLLVPSEGGDGSTSRRWAFAFEFVAGVSTGDQAILGVNDAAALTIYRKKSGDMLVTTSSTASGAAGDLAPRGQVSVVTYKRSPLTRYEWTVDAAAAVANGVIDPASVPADDPLAVTIGASALGEYLDGDLYSVRAWRKPLSTFERELCYRDLAADGVVRGFGRYCPVETRTWADGTGVPSQRQGDRLRPLSGEPHTYKLATLLGGGPSAVQFGCEQHDEGVTLEDDLLGADLYSCSVVERAGPVGVFQESGWSSVFELSFTTPGHYTLQFKRPNHGAKIVHLDVTR